MEINPVSYGSSGLMVRKEGKGAEVPADPGNRRHEEAVRVHTLQAKGYHPIGRSLFIDVEVQDGERSIDDRSFILWPDYRTRMAFTRYQRAAEGSPPRTFHTVDLFV